MKLNLQEVEMDLEPNWQIFFQKNLKLKFVMEIKFIDKNGQII